MKEYKRPHRDEWSQEELKKLRELYPRSDKTIEEIVSQLPGRTQNAIRLKASRLGLIRPFTRHWTPNSILCPYCGQPIKEAEVVLREEGG
jgi:hypothetical protein